MQETIKGWKWAGVLVALALLLASVRAAESGACSAGTAASEPVLVRWLSSQPEFRLGVERDYGPFVFVGDDDSVQGLSIDALGLVARHVGLRYQPTRIGALSDLLGAARQGQVDLLTSLRKTPDRSDYLLFTSAYAEVPTVVVGRRHGALSLAGLTGQRVGVGQGYAVESFVRARYPEVLWQAFPDDAAALRAVAEGRLEASVVDVASFAFVQGHRHVAGLERGEPVGFHYPLSFAVRKDLPQLRDALDLGVRSLTVDERRQLQERWLSAVEGTVPQ